MSQFFLAYEKHFVDALSEIQAGAKSTCWAWFMRPTPLRKRHRGRRSAQSDTYALSFKSAWDFVHSDYLCPRWLRLLKAVTSQLRSGIPSRTLRG